MAPNDISIKSPEKLKLAIFDIDETFVRGDSFKWFCWFAVRANGIRLRGLWRFAFDALTHPTNLLDAGLLKKWCLRICLVNHDKAALTTLVKTFVESVLFKRVRSAALDRLRWHKTQNHTIVFLSASPDLYLIDLGARLGVDDVICTKFLSQDGQFTGDLFSANCKGDEKRRRLRKVFPATDIAWDQSYGYGNSVDDVSFLELLGNAVVVNPDRRLKKLAVQRNWRVENWSC
jgi:HAD superfamily hydrolase (TIGR01490 family)